MDWIIGKQKTFHFIGKRGLTRADCLRKNRKQLVGLKPKDPNAMLHEGGQLVNAPNAKNMQGHVTSSYYNANLGHSFALALIKSGLQRMGETLVHSCIYDLSPNHFSMHQCVQTKFGEASALIYKRSEQIFDLIIRRSFADYIGQWCIDASSPYGYFVKEMM